jgi:regulator of cell morphogenesis and NO signaling
MTQHSTTKRTAVDPASRLADLARDWAGASRVFHRHELDFCCQGHRTLAEACRERRLDVTEIARELLAEIMPIDADHDWRMLPQAQLIAHIVDGFHADHRRELPRLIAMAEKVERVHADKPGCPLGLAEHLHGMQHRLEQHMQKEEQILFPMLLAGAGAQAQMPIHVMTGEHDEHALDLQRVRTLAGGFTPPEHACTTWRALYLGLDAFERSVMEHIHLENHVLFPAALAS